MSDTFAGNLADFTPTTDVDALIQQPGGGPFAKSFATPAWGSRG